MDDHAATPDPASGPLRASDLMSSPVTTVGPDTSLPEIARILVESGIGGVPVVDEQGAVIGIVTESDLLLKGAGAPGGIPRLAMFVLPRGRGKLGDQLERVEGTSASEIMTTKVSTAPDDMPARQLAALMSRDGIGHVPIMRDNELVGMITRSDILRIFLRPDEDIAAEVRQSVGTRLDPERFTVEVREGVVRFTGHVDKHSDRRVAEVHAWPVDGVVGVDVSGLAFDDDDLSW